MAVAVFPEPSVTVQVTVVSPNGKAAGALFVTLATEQLSAVVGVPRATLVAVQAVFVVAFTVAGAVIVGLTLSVTVTVAVPVATFPFVSTTLKTTVLAPILAQVKLLGATLILEIPQLSVEPLLI